MRIKKFVAPTMKEAMVQLKNELGPDAIILKSDKVKKGGIMDFGGKEVFEVLGAVDKDAKVPRKKKAPVLPRHTPLPEAVSAKIQPERPPYIANMDKMQLTLLQSELNDMKQNIAQVGQFLKYRNVPSFPKNLQMIMKQLLDNEVEEEIARSLVEEIHNELRGTEYDDLRLIVSVLLKKINGMISVACDSSVVKDAPRVISLIGPTGVGKTTTIAKLATNQKLLNKKKVALISADTFRIGAIDQLKTFANIADIPLSVVYKPEDMRAALKNYREMDVVYIDTTGRSQRDTERLRELKKSIETADAHETHLVLSVSTRMRDLLEVTHRFSLLKYNRLLLTKLDETASLGIILNLASRVKQPVSYITFGQNVPEDIERATVEKLSKMIVRRKSN